MLISTVPYFTALQEIPTGLKALGMTEKIFHPKILSYKSSQRGFEHDIKAIF